MTIDKGNRCNMFNLDFDDGRINIIDTYDSVETQYAILPREEYGIPFETAKRYVHSLCNHILAVREAGKRIGVSDYQLRVHDQSKFSENEFPYYAMNFHGDKSGLDAERVSDNFAMAWLHHIHHNPHHWQSWIFPDGFTPKGSTVENGCVHMPNVYALEMIADWMGASYAYTGSWDMQKWLFDNMPKIRVHSKTAAFLRGQLDMLGYADTVYVQRFATEL